VPMNDENKLKQKLTQNDYITPLRTTKSSDDNAYIPMENNTKTPLSNHSNLKKTLILLVCAIGIALTYQVVQKKNYLEKTHNENIRQTNEVKNIIDYLKNQDFDNRDQAVEKLHLNQKTTTLEGKVENKLNPIKEFASKNSRFKGILTRCYIGGHDVHFTDSNGNILEHVGLNTPLHGTEAEARELINQDINGTPITFVFDDHIEVYDYSGNRKK
jgi:hypothetical protein